MARQLTRITGGEILHPRSYQKPLIAAIRNGHFKRACCVWHRRAGKDLTVFSQIVIPEALSKVGNYYYYFPTYSLGENVIWTGKTKEGKCFLDFFPKGSVTRIREDKMRIYLRNKSIIQIVGLDDPGRTARGPNPIGCVFSEYAKQNPEGWDIVSPVLLENGGWAIFIYTPEGDNHGNDLFKMAKVNSNWFCQKLTIDDTKRDALGEDGLPIMTAEDIEEQIKQGKTREFCEQEYYCSFEGLREGTIYGDLMREMEASGRVERFPYVDSHRVYTAWDIGYRDDTAVIFFQYIHDEIRIIDCMAESGKGLTWFLTELETGRRRRYLYAEHIAPWDFEHSQLAADGKSCKDVALERGFRFKVIPRSAVQARIEAVRQILPYTCIDNNYAYPVLTAMRNYHRKINKTTGAYEKNPQHDKHSHICDAMGTLAQGFVAPKSKDTKRPTRAITDFDPRVKGYAPRRRLVKVKTGWNPPSRGRY